MKLAVLFGGVSSEHEISCLSAASILRNLDKDKYDIYAVGITWEGKWYYCPTCDPDRIENGAWERMADKVPAVLTPDRGIHGLLLMHEGKTEAVRIDCVFPVLHGVGGEDGPAMATPPAPPPARRSSSRRLAVMRMSVSCIVQLPLR